MSINDNDIAKVDDIITDEIRKQIFIYGTYLIDLPFKHTQENFLTVIMDCRLQLRYILRQYLNIIIEPLLYIIVEYSIDITTQVSNIKRNAYNKYILNKDQYQISDINSIRYKPEYMSMVNDLIYNPELEYHFIYYGFVCRIKQRRILQWHGYVEIPSTHPNYNRDIDIAEYNVHGGITYSDTDHKKGITTFSFDTLHTYDFRFLHLINGMGNNIDSTYKDYLFVENETKQLAEQVYNRYQSFIRTCATCSTISFDNHVLSCCGRCKRVYYCSKQCQQQSWPEHKKQCIL